MSENKPSAELSLAVIIDTLLGWIKFLFSKWVLFLLVGLSFGLLGILYAWLQKAVYTAELTFAVEEESGGGFSSYAGIAAQFGLDLGKSGGGAFSGENLIELMKSKKLVEKTLNTQIIGEHGKQTLLNYYVDTKLKDSKKEEKSKLDQLHYSDNYEIGTNRFQDSILSMIVKGIIKQQLTIEKVDKKLSIVSAKFKDGDELFAKTFVENLTSTVIQFYVDYRIGKSRQNVDILQKQTDSVNHLITYGIGAMASSSDLNVNPIRQVVKVGTQRRQVDLQVNGALYGELLKNLELSKIALRKQTPLIQIIDTPSFPLEKKKLGRLMGGIIFSINACAILAIFLLIRKYLKGTKEVKGKQPIVT